MTRSLALLLAALAGCSSEGGRAAGDSGLRPDTRPRESGPPDAGPREAAPNEAGPDGAPPDGAPPASLDPLGCTPMSDAELRAVGYEPVRAHGAAGDGNKDDTAAIQAAIDAANQKRRAVYLHPGTYRVSKPLLVRQDVFETRSNGGGERFGNVLLGSYCGSERPTLRLADGVATTTDEKAVSAEPFAVITIWRPLSAGSPPDDTHGGRDWNQVVRNLRIVLGKNPGAVGVRHAGAEGCSLQEVFVDATGGFAGLYQVNSSGGYTYDVEVVGGKYGVYIPNARGGATLLAGLRLSGQEETPIASGHYTPLTLVGFAIEHDDGRIISSITGNEGSYAVPGELRPAQDSGGHVALVDGRIDVTGTAPAILANTSRSVYLKDVHVRGASTIVANAAPGGDLLAATSGAWTHVTEYAYSGAYLGLYGEESKLVAGAKTDDTFHDGKLVPAKTDLTVTKQVAPPVDLISRHLYGPALCNVEGKGVVFVTDHGADPNTPGDDTKGIQAAITAAAAAGKRVFLPAGSADAAGAIPNRYVISDTLVLAADTTLCGVSRYASILDARGWKPAADRPVIETPDDKGATTAIADFKIELPKVEGSQAQGYAPHVYGILWRAGRGSIYRDVWYYRVWGDPGDRRTVVITKGGGGRWYGVTSHGGYLPPDVDPGGGVSRPYTVGGQLVLSPGARHILISGTTEPLAFYPFHCQHMTPPKGAQCELSNAANVTFYAVKSESASTPQGMHEIIQSNPADLVPAWMRITGSKNIAIVSHEGLCEQAAGRGLIEISGSTSVTVVNMGRRSKDTAAIAEDKWDFVLESPGGNGKSVSAEGFLSLYRN